jgi:Fe-Mn family superoxide dismutase
MELHHKKHHQAYVNGLNAAEQQYASAATPRAKIALQAAIKFNGGGTSHCAIWLPPLIMSNPRSHQSLSFLEKHGSSQVHQCRPYGSQREQYRRCPQGWTLKAEIDRQFGSLDALKKEFNTIAAGIQGSGWAWLSLNPMAPSRLRRRPTRILFSVSVQSGFDGRY